MAQVYNQYVMAINSEIDRNIRREYLSSVAPIIKRIISQADVNANLLNYFVGINNELINWTSRIPNNVRQVSDFAASLDKSFSSLSILKSKLNHFEKNNQSSTFKNKFEDIKKGAVTTMRLAEIETYIQKLSDLEDEIIAFERKQAKDAEDKRKRALEEERRRIAAEEERLRLLAAEEERLKKEREQLYWNIAKWAGIIIGAFLLLKFVIIPIIIWIIEHIVGIIVGLVIISFLYFKFKD